MKRYIRSSSEVDHHMGFAIGYDNSASHYYVNIGGHNLYHPDIDGVKAIIESYKKGSSSLKELVEQFGYLQ